MDEVFENREQIEISKFYERQPKPVLVAIEEFQAGELSYRTARHDGEEAEKAELAITAPISFKLTGLS